MRTRAGLLACLLTLAADIASGQTVTLDPGTAVATARENDAVRSAADEAALAAQAAAQARPNPATPAPAARPGFTLRRVDVPASRYFTAAEMEAIVAPLRGRRIAGGAAVAAAVNAAYAQRGIGTAQAQVVAVEPGRGVVRLDLLEAELGVLRTEGMIGPGYLSYRLGLEPGSLADNRLIEDRLIRLRLTDGMSLQLGYAPGAAHGQTDVIVAQPEIPRHATTVTVNNYGPASEGEAQLVLSHSIRSLTGWNDPLSLSATFREGGANILLSYARVVTRDGGSLSFTLSAGRSDTLSTPRFEGDEAELAIGYSHPLIVSDRQRLTLTFGAAAFRETGDLLGVRTLDQRGRELSFGLAWYRRGDGWSLSATPRLLLGRGENAVTSRTERYSALQLTLFHSRRLGAGLVGSLTFNGQAALDGVMPSQRKFTVTSASGVRGYPASLSSGDSGYYLRLQLEKATPYTRGRFAARPFGFVDMGEAWDSTDTALGRASSAGMGVTFAAGDQLFGDVFVAKPLTTDITGWAVPDNGPSLGLSMSVRF
jgi:hemolysin activation/secretion protein